MPRGLSMTFFNDLNKGFLNSLLDFVKKDDTLCLEIREDAINIYYRGGSLLQVTHRDNRYTAFFNPNYLISKSVQYIIIPPLLTKKNKVITKENIERYLQAIPVMKQIIDFWIGENNTFEKEFQQLMIRENNTRNLAVGTDYFICDIEYAAGAAGRFDLVAVKWPSSGLERKKDNSLRLALIEMKYMDNALRGYSGLQDHINKTDLFLRSKGFNKFIGETKTVFNQKLELELITNKKAIKGFGSEKPEYILVLANHDPDSSILYNELKNLNIPSGFGADLKVAVGNFMGYGLFSENIYDLKDFEKRFSRQVYSKLDKK